jgi:SAM-dependent methyltransferase
MPWLIEAIPNINGPMLFSIQHEGQLGAAKLGRPDPFHSLLCPDPTLSSSDPRIVGLPRFIPTPVELLPSEPEVFTLSSFGFPTPGKGFEKLCQLVNEQFDVARVRINIPKHDRAEFSSQEAFDEIVSRCLRAITKSNIRLDITDKFMGEEELIAFLAESSINAFAYERESEGISSCIDYALAARRPIAVNGSPMFRHVHGLNPSIRFDKRSLAEIAGHGFAPLVPVQEQCSARYAGMKWNEAILRVYRQLNASDEVPDGRGFNKILDDRSRVAYASTISDLKRLVPKVIEKKTERANVQQAFAFDAVKHIGAAYPSPRILAVGSFESTAVAALKADGYRLDEIDPNINRLDLAAFYTLPATRFGFYDLILCVSVLEHVEDDEQFVRMIADLLAPNGTAIFTVDFSERHADTRMKPGGDYRLYTSTDLSDRLMKSARDCVLSDPPSWADGHDDFEFGGCRYSLATWVFRKHSSDELAQVRLPPPEPFPSWQGRLEVGVALPPGIRTYGLYNVESYEGHPLRWAAKHAEIVLPLNPISLPKSLCVRFWGIAPAGGTEFRLLVNGVELVQGRLNGMPVEHTVTLPRLEGKERLLIQLDSPGFQIPGDSRVLGLAIESIALLQ